MADPFFESLIDEFLLEARERIDRVEGTLLGLEGAAEKHRSEMRDDARRELHTLKGNAAMMGLSELQATAHELEDQVESLDLSAIEIGKPLQGVDLLRRQLESVKGSGATEGGDEPVELEGLMADQLTEAVRVPFAVLDALVERLQEIVIFRNRLNDVLARGRARAQGEDLDGWEAAREAEEALHRTLERLQEDVMAMRLVPLKTLFRHLQRVVHDESVSNRKQVILETVGGDTPMDKALLEVANDALGHLVRNAVIHGIETREEREERGKPSQGTVRLTASTKADQVQIEVSDDGQGIDVEALRNAAASRGIEIDPGAGVEKLIFHPGLSTRQEADLSAGRGIGLSAVLDSVERQAGRIETFTELGAGSRFLLHLPLTVSVTQALLVRTDEEQYALPFSSVVESRVYQRQDLHEVDQRPLIRWRQQFIPLVDIGCFFGTSEVLREAGEVVVVDVDGRPRALLADAVDGSRDIVVKGLDAICGSPAGVSGSTILGDGHVVLILDPARMGSGGALMEEVEEA